MNWNAILLTCEYNPKQYTDSMQFLTNPKNIFTEIEKYILKFIWNFKEPQMEKKNHEKEEKNWRAYTSMRQNFLQSYRNHNSVVLA